MKTLAWLLGVVALAVALSLAVRGNGGYALFVLPPWRAEISLNLLVILAVTGFAIAYLLASLLLHTLRLPSRVRAFRERRRDETGRATLLRALQALFEGRFLRAEKLASEAGRLRSVPALAGLIAARAAQRLREFSRRDDWLAQAEREDGDWRAARLMTTAELLLEERRFDEARVALRDLMQSGPRHAATLLLTLRAEQGLSNWDEVIRLARLLEKHDAMPPEALEGVRVNARLSRIEHLARDPQGPRRLLGRAFRRPSACIPESPPRLRGLSCTAATLAPPGAQSKRRWTASGTHGSCAAVRRVHGR